MGRQEPKTPQQMTNAEYRMWISTPRVKECGCAVRGALILSQCASHASLSRVIESGIRLTEKHEDAQRAMGLSPTRYTGD